MPHLNVFFRKWLSEEDFQMCDALGHCCWEFLLYSSFEREQTATKQPLLLFAQIDRSICIPLCSVLLLQEIQHVWSAPVHRILWLLTPRMLCLLPDARHRLVCRLAEVHPLHIRQH